MAHMGFFKTYKGSTQVWLVRMDRSVWVLIYGGLAAVVLAAFTENTQGQDASALYWGGGIAVLAGVFMIYLRSKLHD